jgi:hypothetical protein
MRTDVLDDLDELVEPVALPAGKVDEFLGARDHGASLERAGDRDATTSSELEQSFLVQHSKSPKHGVGVDGEDGSEILWRKGDARPVSFRPRRSRAESSRRLARRDQWDHACRP